MKITNKQYAQSLYEATKGKREAELTADLDNFVQVLASQNDISRHEAIMLEFGKVWQVAEGRVEAEVASAAPLAAETLAELEAYVVAQTGASQVDLSQRLDPTILAGFVLRFGDQVLDGSVRQLIGQLKKVFIK